MRTGADRTRHLSWYAFPHIAEYNRALALLRLGRYRESYEGYRKVLALETGYTPAVERLGEFAAIRRPVATSPSANWKPTA